MPDVVLVKWGFAETGGTEVVFTKENIVQATTWYYEKQGLTTSYHWIAYVIGVVNLKKLFNNKYELPISHYLTYIISPPRNLEWHRRSFDTRRLMSAVSCYLLAGNIIYTFDCMSNASITSRTFYSKASYWILSMRPATFFSRCNLLFHIAPLQPSGSPFTRMQHSQARECWTSLPRTFLPGQCATPLPPESSQSPCLCFSAFPHFKRPSSPCTSRLPHTSLSNFEFNIPIRTPVSLLMTHLPDIDWITNSLTGGKHTNMFFQLASSNLNPLRIISLLPTPNSHSSNGRSSVDVIHSLREGET